MEEILTIHVTLDESMELQGVRQGVRMISFSGMAQGAYFQGRILPHGVDTQRLAPGMPPVLSARYMLEGTDDAGKPCRMFVENNGMEDAYGVLRTKPVIITDSRSLAWMEDAALEGTVEGCPGGVRIHIYRTGETREGKDMF